MLPCSMVAGPFLCSTEAVWFPVSYRPGTLGVHVSMGCRSAEVQAGRLSSRHPVAHETVLIDTATGHQPRQGSFMSLHLRTAGMARPLRSRDPKGRHGGGLGEAGARWERGGEVGSLLTLAALGMEKKSE